MINRADLRRNNFIVPSNALKFDRGVPKNFNSNFQNAVPDEEVSGGISWQVRELNDRAIANAHKQKQTELQEQMKAIWKKTDQIDKQTRA